jgi:hypothetical protein
MNHLSNNRDPIMDFFILIAAMVLLLGMILLEHYKNMFP